MLLAALFVVLSGLGWKGGHQLFREESISPHSFPPSATSLSAESPDYRSWISQSDLVSENAISSGVSFIVAMIFASMLRVAFKTALSLFFFGAIAVWFLSSKGYVDLWDQYYAAAREGGTWLGAHAKGVLAFLREHLPSTGAALVGFGFGLRR